jgi:hypothetical protein
MSTLWTPDGERPIRRESPAPSEPSPSGGPASGGGGGGPVPGGPQSGGGGPVSGGGGGGGGRVGEPSEEELAAQLAQMQEQLARTPAEIVIANHAFGLFELAALHLSQQPPKLDQARLAIDALGALVEGMTGRLGTHEPELIQGLGQLRLAFVQISAAQAGAGGEPG